MEPDSGGTFSSVFTDRTLLITFDNQFNLADFTRRAYGTNYVETLRVQIHANCRIRRVYFSDRYTRGLLRMLVSDTAVVQVVQRGGATGRVQVVPAGSTEESG